jgi:hypothetical protein
MSTQQEPNKQDEEYKPTLNDSIWDADEREDTVSAITENMSENALDQFVYLLLELLIGIQEEPSRAQNELKLVLEAVFRHSNAYKLAYELFASRFRLIGSEVSVSGDNVGKMLSKIKATMLKGEPFCTVGSVLTSTRPSSHWIEQLSQSIADALESDLLPNSIAEDLASFIIKTTGKHANDASDHARFLLPIALHHAIQPTT